MMRAAMVSLCAASLLAGGCEKSSTGMPRAKGSGALTAGETSLLARLPAGAKVVFGGNIYDAQRWMSNSALGRAAKAMQPPAMTAWNTCLADQKFQMAGAGDIADGALRMPMFMQGMPIDALRSCATKAGLPMTADDDGQFISIQVDTGAMTMTLPYLAVDGGVYTRTTLALGGLASGQPTATPVTRAELERDQAGLAGANLAGDARMVGWLAKVDRSKPFFFVGSADGTELADKFGLAYGSFDIADGFVFDVTIELREPGAANSVVGKWRDIRTHLDQIPPSMAAMKDVIRAVRIGKVGDGIRVVARVTDAQLEAVMGQFGPLLPNFAP